MSAQFADCGLGGYFGDVNASNRDRLTMQRQNSSLGVHQDMRKVWLSLKSLGLLSLLFAALCVAAPKVFGESSLVPIKLPRGVQVQLPIGWRLLTTNDLELVQTSVNAAMDLSRLEIPNRQESTNLIAANSMPSTSYASVRIDSISPARFRPADVRAATMADLKAFEEGMHDELSRTLPLQDFRLLQMIGVRKDIIAGAPSIVFEYRRTGVNGSVFVQINQVFARTQEIKINLAYRESEAALWKPLLLKIRESISLTE